MVNVFEWSNGITFNIQQSSHNVGFILLSRRFQDMMMSDMVNVNLVSESLESLDR